MNRRDILKHLSAAPFFTMFINKRKARLGSTIDPARIVDEAAPPMENPNLKQPTPNDFLNYCRNPNEQIQLCLDIRGMLTPCNPVEGDQAPLPHLDCFGIGDWRTIHHVAVSGEETIGEFPWSSAMLDSPCPFHAGKMIRETHFALVGLDHVTIIELQKLYPRSGKPRFEWYENAWYSNETFATKETLQCRWYLLLRDIVPGSEGKEYDEQVAMLPKEYEVPSAVAETAKDLFVFQKTGKHANPYRFARTADLDSDRDQVCVGCCAVLGYPAGSTEVAIGHYETKLRPDLVGIGASRKSESE
jgi:hypothetical protein